MHDDNYSTIEAQYNALVQEIEKYQETINQLNARLDQCSARISASEDKFAEFEQKLDKLERICCNCYICESLLIVKEGIRINE